MAENSGIEWTHHTFNCWRGCTKVSPGCTNCYADTMSKRNPGTLGVWGPNGSRVVAAESYWRQPLKWNEAAACIGYDPDSLDPCKPGRGYHVVDCPQQNRPRVFCASMADVFEDWGGKHVLDPQGNVMWERQGEVVRSGQTTVEKVYREQPATLDDVRRRLFWLIDATPNLDWLVLTKRPENIARMLPVYPMPGNTRPNLWLGTSVEDQAAADERIPHLLRVPAAVRFLSCEPLLGPVDLTTIRDPHWFPYLMYTDCLKGQEVHEDDDYQWIKVRSIDWVIVGGESGPKARPCDVAWIRSIRDQCKAAGVPVFVKQLGADVLDLGAMAAHSFEPEECWPAGTKQDGTTILLRDKKGGDWSEWPTDLRVRQFPQPVTV